ncbi:MAG: hypothetical protein ABIE74_03210 [Pseudomonadota bacterium]
MDKDRKISLSELILVDLNAKKVILDADNKPVIKKLPRLEYKLAIKTKDSTAADIKKVHMIIVNGNKDGPFPNTPDNGYIKCSATVDNCEKYGLVCDKIKLKCVATKMTNVKLLGSAEVGPAKPCSEGLKRTQLGDCGCEEKNKKWGRESAQGFEAKYDKQNKTCEEVPRCNGIERWNITMKKCEPCGDNDYNAWYDSVKQGKMTECIMCGMPVWSTNPPIPYWQDPITNKPCSFEDRNRSCRAICRCPDKFKKIEIRGEANCVAPSKMSPVQKGNIWVCN